MFAEGEEGKEVFIPLSILTSRNSKINVRRKTSVKVSMEKNG